MLRCVLYIPPGPGFQRWRDLLAAYCHSRQYAVVAITTTWAAAYEQLRQGEAVVAVVGSRDHLPRDRTPRLEVVNEQPARRSPAPMSRRPSRRNRADG